MKKRIILATITILVVGICCSVVSLSSLAEIDRKVVFDDAIIPFKNAIISVDGVTYIPLRETFEYLNYQVDWINTKNGDEVYIFSNSSSWDYKGWKYYPDENIIVPDAETAFAIADILLKNEYKDNKHIKFEAGAVEFNEERQAWIIYGKMVGESEPNLDLDVPGMVVLRKSDGKVLWLS